MSVEKFRIETKSLVVTLILVFNFLLFFRQPIIAADFKDDQILVKLNPSLSSADRLSFHRDISGFKLKVVPEIALEVLQVNSSGLLKTLDRLKSDPRVIYAEPNYLATTYELSNDPAVLNNSEWGVYKIKAADANRSAWNLTHGSKEVKVAVVDTGIDQNHEDLGGKIVGQKNCTSSNTSDDLYGHGTHVAGTIAALTNNAKGVAGVGYNTTLINAKALGDNGSGYYSWIAECIVWSTDNGAKVISMSLGGSSSSKAMEDAINYAWNKGVVLVAAAGNSGNTNPSYPGYFSQVISVAATDSNDAKASFSNFGSWVDVAAPGVSIYSTLPNHQNAFKKLNYGYLSGTSMATPHVAGLAGLLFSLGNLDNQKVVRLIEENSDRISETGSSWIWGRINVYKSVTAFLEGQLFTPTPTLAPTITPSPKPTATPTLTPTSVPASIPAAPTAPTAPKSPSKTPFTSRFCSRYPQFC
ncbi:hypothetical protein A2960_00440 [Candidatus Gottesmanbacteria bacterium RIFCSPLOWO2_01_FULL_39_12b]|uniref:Uncharacterized protein n=1 Tax=Candidatus Gottesmanbacteria bacterium RIFCSPLOWO2_01_FULL_39_12b TaxID=1798388 RepID=A0A1F6APL2_9BACT|nr:MAG: hypothetical protein A2960_00440 [Candidatus Gottesmanbacteria bacterium RIFCSPLOWO2_01_FULL_39_12b]